MSAAPKPRAKPVDREGPIHRSILRYLRTALPGAVIHHSPNETKWRSEKAMRVVAKAKANGTLPGFPDLLVIWRGYVLGFEVKAEGGKLSKTQHAVGADMIANGARWSVVRSIDEVAEYLRNWGLIKSPNASKIRGSQ